MRAEAAVAEEDLSGTAQYTAGVWSWYGVPGAHLLGSKTSDTVFNAVNALVRIQHLERRGSPSLRHSLVQRHQLISHLVDRAEPTCAVELAAGLSPRGATFSARDDLHYIEVDRAPVVGQKRELLQRTPEGQAVLDRPNYQLVDGDAFDVDLDAILPTTLRDGIVVVFEGLMPYLDEFAQRKLFAHLASQAAAVDGLRIIFDHVPWVEQPSPGPIGRQLGKWFADATAGGFRRDDRTRGDLVADLDQAGFTTIEIHDPALVPASWPVSRWPNRVTQTLVFEASIMAAS